ncbi:MAG: hypothetical protein OHK0037_38130 [Elainellaceae cyanobacterium]
MDIYFSARFVSARFVSARFVGVAMILLGLQSTAIAHVSPLSAHVWISSQNIAQRPDLIRPITPIDRIQLPGGRGDGVTG